MKIPSPYGFLESKPCGGGNHIQLMSTESKQKAIEYAKNYPLVQNDSSLLGPVSVGNIGRHDDRVIINLCIRTTKSNPLNATISFPADWKKASQFKPGDQVNVKIESGYVRNIWAAKPEILRTSKTLSIGEILTASEEIAADNAVKSVMEEVSQQVVTTEETPF